MRYLIFVLGLMMPAAASACPDIEAWGEKYSVTGKDLYSGGRLDVVAGGGYHIGRCNLPRVGRNAEGYVTRNPDFTIDISRLGGYELEFRVVGECDTVLLINTGNANWFYDDDDYGDGDAKIRLTSPSEGLYDVWVGTYGTQNCDATLILETY